MNYKALLIVAMLGCPWVAGAELLSMDDDSLSSVAAQRGINIGFSLDLNTTSIEVADNLTVDAPVAGCGTGNYNGGPGTADTCRLAIEIVNRTNEWLVFKDFYGHMRIPDLYIDGGTFLEAGGAAFFDGDKFRDDDGTCLLGDCTTSASLNSLNAIVLSFPDQADTLPTPSYNPATGVSTGYDDLSLALSIGGLAVEYGATGYDNNDRGSFLGLRIADNNNIYAGADVQGKIYINGF